jgi:hypothetical protein
MIARSPCIAPGSPEDPLAKGYQRSFCASDRLISCITEDALSARIPEHPLVACLCRVPGSARPWFASALSASSQQNIGLKWDRSAVTPRAERHDGVRFGVKLGHSAMSAQCPHCPKDGVIGLPACG